MAVVGSGMRVELVVEGVGDTMRLRKREMKRNERLYNEDTCLRCIIKVINYLIREGIISVMNSCLYRSVPYAYSGLS